MLVVQVLFLAFSVGFCINAQDADVYQEKMDRDFSVTASFEPKAARLETSTKNNIIVLKIVLTPMNISEPVKYVTNLNIDYTIDDKRIFKPTNDGADIQIDKYNGSTLQFTFNLEVGDSIGTSAMNITVQIFWENGSDAVILDLRYDVDVLRNKVKRRAQVILNCVSVSLTMLLLLVVFTDVSITSVTDSAVWIGGTVLVQAILLPLVVLFLGWACRLTYVSKVGLITATFSPPPLEVVAFAVVLGGDVPLITVLTLLSLFLSNVFATVWSMQFEPEVVAPYDIPYAAINIILLLALAFCVAGRCLPKYRYNLAQNLRILLYPVSYLVAIFFLLSTSFGAQDLIEMVDRKTVTSSLLYTSILFIVLVVYFLASGAKFAIRKSVVLFILIKGTYLVAFMFNEEQLKSDLAMLTASFLSFVSIITTFVVALVSVFIRVVRDSGCTWPTRIESHNEYTLAHTEDELLAAEFPSQSTSSSFKGAGACVHL